jgi:hypothetical protein
MPALLRHARTTYGSAMRTVLAEAGYDDSPRNGLHSLAGLAMEVPDVPLGQLIVELGVSKQAAGQLVDALVQRGYLDRAPDMRRSGARSGTPPRQGQSACGVLNENFWPATAASYIRPPLAMVKIATPF